MNRNKQLSRQTDKDRQERTQANSNNILQFTIVLNIDISISIRKRVLVYIYVVHNIYCQTQIDTRRHAIKAFIRNKCHKFLL